MTAMEPRNEARIQSRYPVRIINMIDSRMTDKYREMPRYADSRGGRIDCDRAQFNLRIPRSSAETARFAEVPWLTRGRPFGGPNDHSAAR